MADSDPKKPAGFRLHLTTVIFLLLPPTSVGAGMMTFGARDWDRLSPGQFGAMIAGGVVGPLMALLAGYIVYRLFGRSNGWANAVCILLLILMMLGKCGGEHEEIIRTILAPSPVCRLSISDEPDAGPQSGRFLP